MNSYEILLSEASENGLIVKEKPLKYNNAHKRLSRRYQARSFYFCRKSLRTR